MRRSCQIPVVAAATECGWAVADSPWGRLLLAECSGEITAVTFTDSLGEATWCEELASLLAGSALSADADGSGAGRSEMAAKLGDRLVALLTVGDEGALATLPVATSGSPLEMAVWSELRRTRCGERLSYSELAKRIARPRAVRAVAAACGRNRLALLVPCHRVVGKDGSLRGYRWGLKRKAALLAHEAELAGWSGQPQH